MPGCSYEGARLYFVTILTWQRRPRFTDAAVVHACNDQILRAAAVTKFRMIKSCYMPDHLHLIVEGTTTAANLRTFVKKAKQLSTFHVKRRFGFNLWRKGYHDRIVRHDENPQGYVDYICQNPVAAGLVENADDYPFTFGEGLFPGKARPARGAPQRPA